MRLISYVSQSRRYTTKKVQHHRTYTHYSGKLVGKIGSTDYLANSLSVGSMNRLHQFQDNVMVTRGLHDRGYDKDLVNLVLQYSWHPDKCQSMLDYLKSLKDDDGYLFSRNLRIYSKTEEAMARFADSNHQSFRYNRNYQKAKSDLIKLLSRSQLKPLEFHSDSDIRKCLPKTSTHSGFTYIETGKKKKGENLDGSFIKFESMVNDAIDSDDLSFHPLVMIGFRTQASGEFDDDGNITNYCKHKVRIVSMIDLISIINELQFSVPVQRMLANEMFYAGGKSLSQMGSIISHYRSIYQCYASIDYKSFDQTISDWLIEDAFDVLHECFVLNERQEKMWRIMVNDFVHKDFIVGEGVLHSDKGVPSGSMFTQIIDSIVNNLVVSTYFNHLQIKKDMICMGDDNLIFIRMNDDQFSLEDMASYISKRFGLVIDTSDKTNCGNVRQHPIFLKIKWTWAGRWRAPNQLLSRMAYSERRRSYDEIVTPAHVLLGYIMAYPKGMSELIDVSRFRNDYPITAKEVNELVDSRYIPGVLSYIKEYGGRVA